MECGSPIKHRLNDPDAQTDKDHSFTSAVKTWTSSCGNSALYVGASALHAVDAASARPSEVIIPARPFRPRRSVHDLARNDRITHKRLVVFAEFQPDEASGWTRALPADEGLWRS